jgi:hypothetical protein
VLDPGLERELLLKEAQEEAERQAAAAAELIASGNLDGARLSPAARGLLLNRFRALMAAEQDLKEAASHTDTSLGLTLTVIPAEGHSTVIHSDDGVLTVHDLFLWVYPADVPFTVIEDERAMTGTGL